MRTDLRLRGTPIGSTRDNLLALRDLGRRNSRAEESGASLSGHERNHLFLNHGGVGFSDVSGVSGLDDLADGRAFGILDYDRDGWPDVALVNANAPLLDLFRNRIGDREPGVAGGANRMLAVRFVGGNRAATASGDWSTRDGFGAVVEVALDGRTLLREHRAGEGLAAQNSATLLVGLGPTPTVPSVSVRWPSGRTQTATGVAADSLVTFYENPAHSPGGAGVVVEPYKREAAAGVAAAADAPRPRLDLPPGPEETAEARLRLYTTMATWCVACEAELPQLERLRRTFGDGELALLGLPIDPHEDAAAIEAWRTTHRPAYRVLTSLTRAQQAAVNRLVVGELGLEAVPASLLTDAAGRVLHAQWGPPSISKVRQLLSSAEASDRAPRQVPRREP